MLTVYSSEYRGKYFGRRDQCGRVGSSLALTPSDDETGRINSAIDCADGSEGTVPEIAKRYRDRSQPWLIVSDYNYGEGSARGTFFQTSHV